MERRRWVRWAHGHISAFTSCAMVGRSLFFPTLESYFAFCGEKVRYQCCLQSKILSLISNFKIFSTESRARNEQNSQVNIFSCNFLYHGDSPLPMESRHCSDHQEEPGESYVVKLKKILRLTFKHHIEIPWLRSPWLAALVFRSNYQTSNSILWWNHTLTSASLDVLCSLNIIITIYF